MDFLTKEQSKKIIQLMTQNLVMYALIRKGEPSFSQAVSGCMAKTHGSFAEMLWQTNLFGDHVQWMHEAVTEAYTVFCEGQDSREKYHAFTTAIESYLNALGYVKVSILFLPPMPPLDD